MDSNRPASMTHYEALGRYVEATCRIERLRNERQDVASKLQCHLCGVSRLVPVNTSLLESSTARLLKIEADLLEAEREANDVAEACQRPLVYVGAPQ